MANTTIKITQLQNIGNGLAGNTLLPVVNTTGTAITQKVTVGNVANFVLGQAGNTLTPAFLSTLAYSVVNAAQPNITSVGTLNVNTLNISGGTNGYVLQTNGNGNLSWVAQTGSGNGNPGGSNSQLQFNNGGVFAGDPDLTWDAGNNKLTTANLAASTVTISGNANTVNLNATGNVRPNAIYTDHYYYANGYVFGGGGGNGAPGGTDTQIQFNDNGAFGGNTGFTFDKVTGILSSPFLTGNGSGLSSIAGANVTGTVANATYATNIAGANVTGAVTFAGTANSVAVANVVGLGNIATLSLSGSTSNVLYGNGTFAAVPAPTVSQDITSNGAMSIMLYDGNIKYNNYATVEPSTGNIAGGNLSTTGQITSTKAGNLSSGGGQLYLNGSGNNRIDFNTNGTGAPTFTTRSAGAKVVLYPVINGTSTDYALGVDSGTFWSGIPAADAGIFFKWYAGTTEVANLSGTGILTVTGNISGGNISATGNITANNLGNISSINLTGSNSNVLYGNGVFAAVTGGGNTGNVTFSNVTVQGDNNALNLSAGADFTANLAYVRVRSGDVASHIHMDTGNNEAYDLIVGDDAKFIQVSSTGNIIMSSYDGNTSHIMTLDTDGNLILAGGSSVIQSIANSSLDPVNPNVSTMIFTPDQGYSSQSLVLDPTAPGHIHLRAPGSNIDEPTANLFLGGEASSFEVGYSANGSAPNVYIHSNNNTWTFDTTGNLTLPSNLVIAGNTSVFGTNAALIAPANNLPLLSVSSGSNGGVSSLWVEDIGNVGTSNIAAVYTNPTSGSKIVRIAVGQNGGNAGPNLWDFQQSGVSKSPVLSVDTLPSAVAGMRAFVSDANLAPVGNFGAIVGNSGSNTVCVWCDGTNWRIG
jgi:hypothetical protein